VTATPGRLRRRGTRALALAVAAVVLLADQLSKVWAQAHLAEGVVEAFIPGLLQLRRVANTGAAFSLFTGSVLPLALLSAAVSAALLGWILLRPPTGGWRTLAMGLLLGGAAGNGIDRWRLGWVVDFLEFVPIHFPVFNLADVAINGAVLCFVMELLRPHAHRDA
jgi:signal peptidase II